MSVRRGHHRRVVVRGDFVYKRDLDDSKSCLLEYLIWLKAKEKGLEEFFCPVVRWDGKTLVMRRARCPGKADKALAESLGLRATDLRHDKNWGFLDGKSVIVDYGHKENEGFLR